MRQFPRYPKKTHATGQARILVDGKHVYLGAFGSQESWTKYRETMARWQAGDKSLPASGATVAWAMGRYLEHVADEVAAGHLAKNALRDWACCVHPAVALYGREPVDKFGPLQLISVGEAMLSGSWITPKDKARRKRIGGKLTCSRQTVNHRLRKIKKAFRWLASRELIPWEVNHRLAAVGAFRVSRAAPDTREVEPVDPALVGRTLLLLGPVTAAMVQVQQLTGMRSCELVSLTADRIDRDTLKVDGVPVWIFKPEHDKQSHKRKAAPIAFGPRAQALLLPLLAAAEPGKPIFSPRAEMLALYAARRAGAKVKRRKLAGLNLSRFREGYTVGAYYKRIRAACARGGLPHWFPYQLRHLAEVTVERAFTLDAARAVLRHKDAKTTTRYGIIDLQKAAEVAAKIG